MGKTGQFAEKQTAAVQSAGFEKFKTVMSKVNSVINLVGVWLFRLRKFIMAEISINTNDLVILIIFIWLKCSICCHYKFAIGTVSICRSRWASTCNLPESLP